MFVLSIPILSNMNAYMCECWHQNEKSTLSGELVTDQLVAAHARLVCAPTISRVQLIVSKSSKQKALLDTRTKNTPNLSKSLEPIRATTSHELHGLHE
jgi:hypothetical protein